jgi:hypothetical protein
MCAKKEKLSGKERIIIEKLRRVSELKKITQRGLMVSLVRDWV